MIMEKTSPAQSSPVSTLPERVVLTEDEKNNLSKEDLLNKFKELETYVTQFEQTDEPKNVDDKRKLQQQESTRRENVLVMRLATKEQEMQELLTQIQELKQAQTPSTTQLQNMLIDPAVNLLFEKMKTELTETKDRLEQAQNDLSAWKFTPDSVSGKKLMAKCRMLIQENQDLGQQLSQGRIAQLEAELALQKKYSEELKSSQDEMNEFVIQLDEEVEGMQATICALQQQLKVAKEQTETLQTQNEQLKQQLSKYTRTSPTSNGDLDDFHADTNSRSPELPLHTNNSQRLSQRIKTEHEHAMDIDIHVKDTHFPSRTTNLEQVNHLTNSTNQTTVIRSNDESKRDVDEPLPFLSSAKGITKTSFSITHLLSDSMVKRETDNSFETTIKSEVNGEENGILNGEIDDTAI